MIRSRSAGCTLMLVACGALAACAFARADRGPTSAATNSASSGPARAAVPGGGNVHLTEYADNDGMASSVILTGAVGDYGSARREGGRAQLALELSRGTFRLDVSDLDGRFLALLRTLPVNQHSCSTEASASARVSIVPGSGTGAYSSISGAFDLVTTLDEVYHSGACRATAPYLNQKIITTGWGNLALR